MNTISPRVSKRPPAAWLCLPALLIGVLVPLPAQSAPSAATAVRIADLDVSIILGAPPPPRHEVIIEKQRPSRDHVWIAGYWANHRGQRDWVAGHWERPPQGRTVWVEPRWEKRGHGYAFVEGYWAEPHKDNRHDDRHDDRSDDHRDHH